MSEEMSSPSKVTSTKNIDSLEVIETSLQALDMDSPTLSQLLVTLAPATAAADPREPEEVLSDREDALYDSLRHDLRSIGVIDDKRGTAEEIGIPSSSEDLEILCGKVLAILSKLWIIRSQHMLQATEALANGSRNPSMRLVFGQSGILNFFLQIIASKEVVDTSLLLHSLRLVGNSCADNDENRAIVVKENYTSAIIGHVLNPKLIKVVIPVLYNLCIDFEPAQVQLAENQTVYILLKLLKDGAFRNDELLLDFVFELLELISDQEKALELSPDGTISLLIELAVDKNITPTRSQFSSMANCLVTYLENKRYQELCISKHMMTDILSVLTRSLDIGSDQLSSEDIQSLAQIQLKLNQTLAEVSASPSFAETYPIGSPLSGTLKSWLVASNDQLQICSCVMLGNLARSDDVCTMLVQDLKVHEDLILVLGSDARGAVLHSALGFLRNLAIAGDNKLSLGTAGIIPALSRLWAYEAIPQVQFAATSIARQLLISSVENIARLVDMIPSDPGQTYLSLLFSLCRKTDSTPIKTEIGRIVASMCRTIIPKCRGDDAVAQELLNRLFDLHEDVAHPLAAMISQSQWSVVRSEGWFALALMASTKSGSVAVLDCLQKQNHLALIEETLREEVPDMVGEAGGQQLIKDRDNIVVLVQELLKFEADSVPSSWRESVINLINDHVSKRLDTAVNQ